jgi:ABC-type cobalamin/Fe3+-siderophores transport system ATPase subunit
MAIHMFLRESAFCHRRFGLAPITPNTKQIMLRRKLPEAMLAETEELLKHHPSRELDPTVMLALIREQIQIHNTTQRGIAHALHDINNSIQALASAVRNLE